MVDRPVWAGGNAQPVEIASGKVDNRLAAFEAQGPMRANFETLSGPAALLMVDDDLHGLPFPNDKLSRYLPEKGRRVTQRRGQRLENRLNASARDGGSSWNFIPKPRG